MNNQLMFANSAQFRKWLENNGNSSTGIWMIFGKAGKMKTIKPGEALEEALCFGWIDGQIKSVDETQYLTRYTPRRKGSNWSEKNRGLAAKLIEQGRMTEHGLAAIERAKKAGTWETSKREPIGDEQIAILSQALAGFEPALSNFQKMPPSVRRTYTGHYLSAKAEETKKRRLEQIISRLNENKKPM